MQRRREEKKGGKDKQRGTIAIRGAVVKQKEGQRERGSGVREGQREAGGKGEREREGKDNDIAVAARGMQITGGVDVFESASNPAGSVFHRWLASNIWCVLEAWQRRAARTDRAEKERRMQKRRRPSEPPPNPINNE